MMLLRLPQPQPVSLMISGPPGAGKTALASAMATAASLPVIQLRLCDIIATSSSLSPEKKIAEEFFNAVTGGPALVLISQLDQLSKDGGSQGPRNLDRGISRMLCTMIKNLTRESSEDPLLVVAECTHMELLDQRLLDAFSEQILIKPPTAQQRHAILKSIFATEKIDASVDLTYWGLKCSGFLAGDFVRLLNSARRTALKRSLKSSVSEALRRGKLPSHSIQPPPVIISAQDITDALKHVKPVLKNEGFPSVPETTWQDVGGLSEVREELRRKMLDPIKEPDLLAKYNKTSSGILLWGPPGCGKTLLAKAVANEAGVNLLIVNGPDLLSMYQGESERAVRVVFARAASVAPCVIFFDEFDSLCPKRSKTGVESGSKSTIVNTLLTEMSGFLERSGVYVMAATNLPAVLDPAVLRPGRFDTLLYVGLPDIAGREAVLRAATKVFKAIKRNTASIYQLSLLTYCLIYFNGTLPALASDVNLRNIAERCDNFSGADCRHLVEMASTEAFEELKAWRKKQATHSLSNDVFTNNLINSDQRQTDDKLLSGDQKPSSNEVKTTDDTCHMEEGEVDEVASHNSNDRSWATMEDEDANSCSNMNEPEVGSVAPSNILPEGVTSRVTEADKNDQTPVELNPFHEGPYVVYARHFEAALAYVNPSVVCKVVAQLMPLEVVP
ncbi:hypothetical protein HAZT_HAZT005711 [Hyalella azteca]|uniref:AAA+ ATPase domain-containing protein n=1 Tax=Hyalella azteca TaxID=294128 RepID=A0A6A0HBB5_HYAAZ|nr:hypothetical protein HAZT_HAZT005711 [Hyalella azteca]